MNYKTPFSIIVLLKKSNLRYCWKLIIYAATSLNCFYFDPDLNQKYLTEYNLDNLIIIETESKVSVVNFRNIHSFIYIDYSKQINLTFKLLRTISIFFVFFFLYPSPHFLKIKVLYRTMYGE